MNTGPVTRVASNMASCEGDIGLQPPEEEAEKPVLSAALGR